MQYDWEYLYELGYTERELSAFEQEGWADGIMQTLSDPDMADIYQNHVRFLLQFYDKADILSLMVRYTDAFLVGSDTFVSRMNQIAQIMGEDWAEELWEAYCQDEESIFEAVGYLQKTSWNKAVARFLESRRSTDRQVTPTKTSGRFLWRSLPRLIEKTARLWRKMP